jgi:hypothetical protein
LSGRRPLAALGAVLVSPFNVKWRFSALARDVEGSKLCLFSVIMPAKCVSSVSPRFHYRRVAFCFLPLAAILESPGTSFTLVRYFPFWAQFSFSRISWWGDGLGESEGPLWLRIQFGAETIFFTWIVFTLQQPLHLSILQAQSAYHFGLLDLQRCQFITGLQIPSCVCFLYFHTP